MKKFDETRRLIRASYEITENAKVSIKPLYDSEYTMEYEEFLREFSINQYLQLRKKYPNEDPNPFPEPDSVIAFEINNEFSKFGITGMDLCSLLEGCVETQDKVSIILLEALQEHEDLKKICESAPSRRGLVLPLKSIDFIISLILQGSGYLNEYSLCNSFYFLISKRLGLDVNNYYQSIQTDRLKAMSYQMGAMLLQMGIEPSFRKVAKFMKVDVTTISRWFKSKDEFLNLCKEYEKLTSPYYENKTTD